MRGFYQIAPGLASLPPVVTASLDQLLQEVWVKLGAIWHPHPYRLYITSRSERLYAECLVFLRFGDAYHSA